MLVHLGRGDDAVHVHRGTDGQTRGRIIRDIVHTTQALHIYEESFLPETVAHADKDVGTTHKSTCLASVLCQELAGCIKRGELHVIKLRKSGGRGMHNFGHMSPRVEFPISSSEFLVLSLELWVDP